MSTKVKKEFYWDTVVEPTPESDAFAEKLDSQSAEATDRAADNLERVFFDDRSTPRQQYSALFEYREARRTIHLEQLNGGYGNVRNNLVSFEALRRIVDTTDSHYTKRLALWAINEELHSLSDVYGGMPLVDIDQTRSDPDALRRYFSHEDENGWERGLVYGPSVYGEQFLEDYPEAGEMLAYISKQSIEYPGIGESDGTYAPDPYSKLTPLPKSYYDTVRNPGETELTIETVNLFGVPYDKLSRAATNQLFDYGVTLNEEQAERIQDAVGVFTDEKQRVQFAEAFLATEFGSELGESILQIAHAAEHNDIGFDVFHQIASIRKNLAEWESSTWLASPENNYQDYFTGIKHAVEMRISQVLSLIPDLMAGIAQRAEYYHRDGSTAEIFDVMSVEQALQGLKLLNLATRRIAASERDFGEDGKVMLGDDFLSLTPGLDDKVRMTMRAHESATSEARVRWAVSITPQEQQEIFGEYLDINSLGEPRKVKLSVHLDLEKISRLLSFDLGTRMNYSDTSKRGYPDQLLAALVTAGTQHNLRQQGHTDTVHQDYHVRTPFTPELSDPSMFAKFVEAMQGHYVGVERMVAMRAVIPEFQKDAPGETRSNVVYTGLFFDDSTQTQLAELITAKYPHRPMEPHITLEFRPGQSSVNDFQHGRKHDVRIIGIVDDGKAQVLLVDPESVDGVDNPHVTISTNNNENGRPIPPAYSNFAILQAKKAGTVKWLREPVTIHTISGYLDGNTGQIVMQTT